MSDEVSEFILAATRGLYPNAFGWVRVRCPDMFCLERVGSPDDERSFGFNPEQGRYWCWRCHVRGYLPGYERNFDHEPDERVRVATPKQFPEAWPLWDHDGMTIRSFGPARAALRRRGVMPYLWEKYRIHACAMGPWARYFIIPRFADDGKSWDGWIGRAWESKIYKYPTGMTRDRFYRDHHLWENSDDPLLVVEGAFDSFPYENCCACLGKPTPELYKRLANSTRDLVFCLDGDADGDALRAQLNVGSQRYDLKNTSRVAVLYLPPGSDPADLARVDPRAMPFAAKICLRFHKSVLYPPTWRAAEFTVEAVRRWGMEHLPKNEHAWLAESYANLPEAV